ncbi:MAG: hypothetical protein NC300_11365 [Bacteroidales bacterium]|nr:hypothetical protein [Clostridium sp.]MCM1204730.1 hypothetical protein [Bacteroidales bacterium]
MKDVDIYVYTEYAGSMKAGSGKYHVVLETTVRTKDGGKPATLKEMGICGDTTKNRLELFAVVRALSRLREKSRVTVYTSSDYLIGAVTNGWADNWEKNGYVSRGKPVKHADLWQGIMEQREKQDIRFVKADRTPYTRAQASELKQIREK